MEKLSTLRFLKKFDSVKFWLHKLRYERVVVVNSGKSFKYQRKLFFKILIFLKISRNLAWWYTRIWNLDLLKFVYRHDLLGVKLIQSAFLNMVAKYLGLMHWLIITWCSFIWYVLTRKSVHQIQTRLTWTTK